MKCSQQNRAACICQKTQTPELPSLRENTKTNLFTETEVNTPLKAENRLLSYYPTQCVFQGGPEVKSPSLLPDYLALVSPYALILGMSLQKIFKRILCKCDNRESP